eukprot:2648094-Pyramimonas_sp.AAC.1
MAAITQSVAAAVSARVASGSRSETPEGSNFGGISTSRERKGPVLDEWLCYSDRFVEPDTPCAMSPSRVYLRHTNKIRDAKISIPWQWGARTRATGDNL